MTRPPLGLLAQVLAEPRRLQILEELLGGVALPAGSLAARIGVAPSTVTAHVAKLHDARLVDVEQRGRARLISITDPVVVEAVEAVLRLAGEPQVSSWSTYDRRTAMRRARSCYDHLAGDLGVAVADRLVATGMLDVDLGSVLGDTEDIGAELGLRLDIPDSSRPLVRGCLDWTARRPHLAGRLGAAILDAILAAGWVTRRKDDRSLRITPVGAEKLDALQL